MRRPPSRLDGQTSSSTNISHLAWRGPGTGTYFSIVQRKVLAPNDFATLAALEHDLMAFRHRYQMAAKPFHWTVTRADLHQLLATLAKPTEPIGRRHDQNNTS